MLLQETSAQEVTAPWSEHDENTCARFDHTPVYPRPDSDSLPRYLLAHRSQEIDDV